MKSCKAAALKVTNHFASSKSRSGNSRQTVILRSRDKMHPMCVRSHGLLHLCAVHSIESSLQYLLLQNMSRLTMNMLLT